MSKKSPRENQAEKYLWYWKIRKVKPFFSEDQFIHVELYPLIYCVIIQIILTKWGPCNSYQLPRRHQSLKATGLSY